jgi:hypothetical protein
VTQDENSQYHSIHNALTAVAEWEKLLSGPPPLATLPPADGSDLARDDLSVYPYGLSHAALAAISAAVSHLACLRDSLLLQTGATCFQMRFHTHGQFTLIRGALENASRAVWLLESGDSGARCLRRLQQEWAEARDQEKVRQEIKAPLVKSLDTRFAELSALAVAANIDPGAIKKTPDYTTIVRTAGQHVGYPNPATPVVIWKACSAIGHGEVRGMIGYLTKEMLGDSSPQVAQVTSNVLLLQIGVMSALATTRVAYDLYTMRSSAPAA